MCVASSGSLNLGEQQFVLCLEKSDYASRNTILMNTSRSEGETGGGSKIEAWVELQELPEVPEPVTFKAKHGLPTLNDCDVEVFPEDYWTHWTKKFLGLLSDELFLLMRNWWSPNYQSYDSDARCLWRNY